MGGLSRRNTVVEKLRGTGPLFIVDSGDLLWKNPKPPGPDLPQIQEKARLIAEAYAVGGIDAMAPSAGDLALGVPFLKELQKGHDLPYVTTNYTCDGAPLFAGARTLEHDGIRMMVLGVVGNEADRDGCVHTDATEAVRTAVAGTKADVVVLLSDLSEAENQALVKAVPRVDLVVDSNRQQRTNPLALPNGGLALGAGSRGKEVGTLAFTLVPGATRWEDAGSRTRLASQKDRYTERLAEEKKKLAQATDEDTKKRSERQIAFLERTIANVDGELQEAAKAGSGITNRSTNGFTDLGADVADHPKTAELVARAKEKIAAVMPADVDTHVRMGPFAGSAACQGCHAAEAAQWATTAHARATESLKAQKSDQDPACFACHVTGAHHPDGPRIAAEVGPALLEVGCEACHGAGKEHTLNPATVSLVKDPGPAVCLTCHNGVNDEGRFDLAEYRPKIVHGK